MRDLAIRNTHPNVVTIRGEIDAWDSDGNIVELDENKVETEVKRLQADYDAKKYQRDRQPEYPSIPDQLDKIYHSGINEWKKDIKAVKDKYPKP